MFKHSVKVPRLYKIAAKVAKDAKEGVGSIKQLVYENRSKHPNIKAIYALVATLFQRDDEIENLLKRSQLLVKEPRSDPWLTKILIVELLWGKKSLPGNSKPEKTVLAYDQIFRAHISDISTISKKVDQDNKDLIMVEDNDVAMLSAPVVPLQTQRAAKALGILLFYSFLMFSLPFASFFGVKYLLKDYYGIEGYTNTVWSVIASVLTVNMIIVGYVYVAYHEPEYDDEGNLIRESEYETKSNLNLKQD